MEKILTTKMKLKTKRMYLIQLIPPWTIFFTLCFVRCCCRHNNNLTDCDQICHTQSIKWQVKGWQETGFSDCQDLSVFQVTEGMSRWWQERGNDLSSNQMMVKMTHNNNGIRVLCCYCCLWVACLMLMTLSIQRKRMMMRWGWDAGCTDEARETNRGKRLRKSLVREINEEKGLTLNEGRDKHIYSEKRAENTPSFSPASFPSLSLVVLSLGFPLLFSASGSKQKILHWHQDFFPWFSRRSASQRILSVSKRLFIVSLVTSSESATPCESHEQFVFLKL